MPHYLTKSRLLLFGTIALATFFRFYRLDQLPPGFQFDQGFYVFDTLRLLQGEFHIFFEAPGGSEPLFLYAALPGVAFFGVAPLGIKITSALIGVATVLLVYILGRSLFRSTRIGLLAAFFTSISVWHIYYGRYGERITLLDAFVILMYLYLWRALDSHRTRDYIFVGVFVGLGFYTNLAARLLPVAVILMTLYMIVTDRRNLPVYVKGLFVAGVTAILVCIPLGLYFVQYPDKFISHAAQVSIFIPHAQVTGDVPAALLNNAVRLLEMFFVRGDEAMIRNVPYRPVFDPFSALLFMSGVAVLLLSVFSPRSSLIERRRGVLLSVWMLVGMAVSLVTDDAPNFSRLHPIIPAIMILPAWGAVAAWDWASDHATSLVGRAEWSSGSVSKAIPIIAIGVVSAFATVSSYRDYFVTFAGDPGLYYAFNSDKVEVAEWANAHALQDKLYVAPLTLSIGTVSLLTRNAPLKSFESRDTIVLPSAREGKDAVYSFPMEQDRKAETMLGRLGSLAARENLAGSNNSPLMINVRVPAGNLPNSHDPFSALRQGGSFLIPQVVDSARFAGQVELLGHTISPDGPGGRNVMVNLFFRAIRQMDTEYTFSVKARDERGRVWGQEDKWAGNSSYPTTIWSVGEIIVERFYPGLAACAPAGKYALALEIYNPHNMDVLSVDGVDGNSLALGEFGAGSSEGNRYEDLEIGHPLERLNSNIPALFGYELTPDTVKIGSELSLSLYWRGSGQSTSIPVSATVSATLGSSPLFSQKILLPPEGRGLCTLHDVHIPANVGLGKSPLFINDAKITDLEVVP